MDAAGPEGAGAAGEVRDLVVDRPGMRLDRYLADSWPGLTRTQAQKLIGGGFVAVNGAAARSGFKLNAGDRVSVTVPPPEPSPLEPEEIPFGILYEDDDLLVIDKPAGLPVHPAPGHPGHTLVNGLLAHLASLPETDDPLRPGIVHRLDMDTSGVMLVARTRAAHAYLAEQFRSRSVTKLYLALVRGRLTPDHGVIEAPIGRDPRNPKRMAVAPESRGRAARTRYRVARYPGGCSLLEVSPETGRTHQIRVHLAAIGFPVVGDTTYGPAAPPLLARQFLHSFRLGFRLPSTGDRVEFEAPLPPDLEQALASLA